MIQSDMYIRLEGLTFYAFHGVLPQETRVGAAYTVNLRLKTDFGKAAETDDLSGTINYASVYEAVKAEMSVSSKLLEHVAHRIATRLFRDFDGVEEITLSLFKQNPPMGADGKSIGIETTYRR